MRTTFADIKNSRIPKMLGLCATDSKLLDWTNESIQRLLNRGKWLGTTQRMVMCLNQDCITLPRQVMSIEVGWVCNRPLDIKSVWFEYLDGGPWLQQDNSCSTDGTTNTGCFCWGGSQTCYPQCYARGTNYPAFADFLGQYSTTVKEKFRVYCDNPNDVGKTILLQFYDGNGNWVLTNNGATNGELITLALPYVDSTNYCTNFVAAQKEVTLGNVRLYAVNTIDSSQRQIAIYEPDETNPCYTRVVIPNLSKVGACSGTCSTTKVTLIVNLQFIPIRQDTDWLIIGNLPAIKDMCLSLRHRENNNFSQAEAYEASAIRELEMELGKSMGDAMSQPINWQGSYDAGERNII